MSPPRLQVRTTRLAVIGIPAALIALFSLRELLGSLRHHRRSRGGDSVIADAAPGATPHVLLAVPAQPGSELAGVVRPLSRRHLGDNRVSPLGSQPRDRDGAGARCSPGEFCFH